MSDTQTLTDMVNTMKVETKPLGTGFVTTVYFTHIKAEMSKLSGDWEKAQETHKLAVGTATKYGLAWNRMQRAHEN
jgi:hypothetical protein